MFFLFFCYIICSYSRRYNVYYAWWHISNVTLLLCRWILLKLKRKPYEFIRSNEISLQKIYKQNQILCKKKSLCRMCECGIGFECVHRNTRVWDSLRYIHTELRSSFGKIFTMNGYEWWEKGWRISNLTRRFIKRFAQLESLKWSILFLGA